MLKLFVDESYYRDYFYTAGVLVDEYQEARLIERLDYLAESLQHRYQWPESPEFHGHSLMNGLDDWEDFRGRYGSCISTYQKVMHAIQNSGARVYLEGVDVKRLHARYRYPDSPYEITLRHLLERINDYCSVKASTFKVIADNVPRQEIYNSAIQRYTILDTPGYRHQKLTCLDGDIEFIDSRDSRGIQAADMTVYMLQRFLENDSASPESKRAIRRLKRALGPALVHKRKWIP